MPLKAIAIVLLLIANDLLIAGEGVAVQVFDSGFENFKEIPVSLENSKEQYTHPAFAFFRMPRVYLAGGIPDDRPWISALRATASVNFPAGKHRILVRSLGVSRLEIDDNSLIETPPMPGRGFDDLAGLKDKTLQLGESLRNPAAGIFERLIEFSSPGAQHAVTLTFLVGKKDARPELNETTVSVCLEGEDTFYLLSPDLKAYPYTDVGWWAYYEAVDLELRKVEQQRRLDAFSLVSDYWQRRHEYATAWAAKQPVESHIDRQPQRSPIDQILADAGALKNPGDASPSGSSGESLRADLIDEFAAVRKVIERSCLRCHRGDQAEGDLHLDQWNTLTQQCDSGAIAVVPGQPEQSEFFQRITSVDTSMQMPPKDGGEKLSPADVELIRSWIQNGARHDVVSSDSRQAEFVPLNDNRFLRKAFLDCVGVGPSLEEIRQFENDPVDQRRSLVIDRLMTDPRYADHWTSYWQNVLGENPNLINPTLNNTGPFRFWIYESLLDNKPFDLFVTELIGMEGGYVSGGPKGFEMASGVDVPWASKAVVLTSAFQGLTTNCARCHDAPFHRTTQKELFEIAAALSRNPVTVPASSSVNLQALTKGARKPLINVSIGVGDSVDPAWPFPELVDLPIPDWMLPEGSDWRDRLAAQITRPENERFAQVIVNRLWTRLMGRGLVDSVDDWEHAEVRQPELLNWLAREFVSGNYDSKRIVREILLSQAYQQQSVHQVETVAAAPSLRMLEPAQIVDSLASSLGKQLTTEKMNLDLDISRERKSSVDLGYVRRCWQLANLTNERDRPSLTLPETQPLVDLIESFGWRSTRGDGQTPCEPELAVAQPATLANGLFVQRMICVTPGSTMEAISLRDQPVDKLIDDLFLILLTRRPTDQEQSDARALLSPEYEHRMAGDGRPRVTPPVRNPRTYLSWSNHLAPGANELAMEKTAIVQRGPEPTTQLVTIWRENLEDLVWAIVNSPEFVFSP